MHQELKNSASKIKLIQWLQQDKTRKQKSSTIELLPGSKALTSSYK
jgi:hypothetical protein